MCPEDTSLLNTEIGDSLVVRAIKQLRRVVVSGRQPLVGCLGLVDNSNVQQKYKCSKLLHSSTTFRAKSKISEMEIQDSGRSHP